MIRHAKLSHVRLLCGLSAALPLLLSGAASADVKLPAIFTSHMVLQQGQADRVWGWADKGEEVTVTIADQTKTAKAGDDGKWLITLDPLKVGGPHTLSVKGKNEIKLDDVLVGEVWLCSGQSNMGMAVGQSNDGDLESLAANFPQIRLISVPQVGTQEPQSDFTGQWEPCTPETVKQFSAVGFFFGRQLHQTLGVPVGLIDDAWGGSACEAWISRDVLVADGKYGPLLEGWAQIEKDYPQAKADYPAKLAAWKVEVEKAKSEGKPAPQAPPNPDGAMFGNHRPGNIYNGVLKPTIGYGIRGAIWYQGESNAGRAYQYRDLFPLMISSWRKEWGIGDFPFYWVQLADFLAETPAPAESAWAELREAQTMTMSKLPNTGEAVIIDIGEGKDIHPRNKQDVGKRLARWALARDYGVQVPYHSPQYKSMEKKDGKIVITLDHAAGGLRLFDVHEPRGFAIAGADRKFVWASAKIIGPSQIEVSSDQVKEPVAVRYAWADNPISNVYGADGLPLTPFRTDDWPGVTASSQAQLAPAPFTHAEDVVYGRKFGSALTLDVFAPKEKANGAAVIFVVSGGWISDHQRIQPALAAEFLKRGYTVFAVVHGSQPRYTIPECIADLNRSVRFIRAHAADYKIDPARIGITGGSAGGHLSLMQGTAGDLGDEKAADPIDRVSSRVQAVGCLFPPTDFLNYGKPGEIALGNGTLQNFVAPFDFNVFDPKTKRFERITDEARRQEIGKQISPFYHATADDPPTLIIHGDADKLVPIQQAELIIDKLKEAGVPAELVVKTGAMHGGPQFADSFQIIGDWFDKHLAARPSQATQ
ncbi:MAG TPA: prolyl oligopeptidase family serine peptidase [Pirellulales bacterium]|nr:prolyl oligopeptidase family serine peptidase [Pirellulales bacterium]